MPYCEEDTHIYTHREETPSVVDFGAQKKHVLHMDAHELKGMHLFTKMYSMHVCTLAHMHRHTKS